MKAGSSPVSEADYAVDRFLRETLLAARPDYGWLSEETADSAARLSARRTFVVDPIDGTRGFLEGRDIWCVSAAVVENGRPLAGVLEVPGPRGNLRGAAGARRLQERCGASWCGLRRGAADHRAGRSRWIDADAAALARRLERRAYIPSLACRIAMIADGEPRRHFRQGRTRMTGIWRQPT